MKKQLLTSLVLGFSLTVVAQTNPAITSWLQNTTEVGSYYMEGNSTAISNNTLVNVQQVQYSNDWVYINTNGIPAYPTGPFLDGNPSQAESQNALFRFPLEPTENTGTHVASNPGNIGVFVNGVALYDYRDGVSWSDAQQALQGGPTGGMGDGVWNRDAIVAEREGFDCSKGHPAMGNYHHHQNPSAFKLDLDVISNICNLYDADGLYVIDETEHSPLIGFAHDGFPIYGAYGYKNTDGTGGIVRIRSGYALRSITTRTTYADGSTVTAGPDVDATYPLGLFREDYGWSSNADPEYLDEHNGRFCVTPEYPDGIYAYFCTVDENHNSAYPYAVGPTFYGTVDGGSVNNINETVTTYTDGNTGLEEAGNTSINVTVFPNPAADLIAVQMAGLVAENVLVGLYDMEGRLVDQTTILTGSTIAYFDTKIVQNGNYVLRMMQGQKAFSQNIVIAH